MTPETTDPRIAEIRAREQQATKGPWVTDEADERSKRDLHVPEGHTAIWIAGPTDSGQVVATTECPDEVRARVDADFIAHARDDVPFLLDALAAFQQRVEALTQALDIQQRKEQAENRWLELRERAESAEQRLAAAEREREASECAAADYRSQLAVSQVRLTGTIVRLRELSASWRKSAEQVRRSAVEPAIANIYNRCANELDAALASLPSPPVSAPEEDRQVINRQLEALVSEMRASPVSIVPCYGDKLAAILGARTSKA